MTFGVVRSLIKNRPPKFSVILSRRIVIAFVENRPVPAGRTKEKDALVFNFVEDEVGFLSGLIRSGRVKALPRECLFGLLISHFPARLSGPQTYLKFTIVRHNRFVSSYFIRRSTGLSTGDSLLKFARLQLEKRNGQRTNRNYPVSFAQREQVSISLKSMSIFTNANPVEMVGDKDRTLACKISFAFFCF